ncbi:hypothetical protein [Roseicyclus persicicus]|uniref:Uncharacterized protein n=1 Tax=Roseicyclus persicicus TaxID=2650661 RepID=A0A7X6GWC4_9RHOB|nr:hypothetical protein [Roseibacterium persicicum]NKX43595.1 hypothetical protein [Roseibacterium persicicum]
MGRDRRNEGAPEHFTKMLRVNMEAPAWRALSVHAQALYPWLKLEWKGPQANNNGRIEMSVRQAADLLGCSRETAALALRDLQRKGWLAVTQAACLGLKGAARGNQYELTEIALPGEGRRPRNLFRDWKPDREFPFADIRTNNPSGRNGRQKPVMRSRTPRHAQQDEAEHHVMAGRTSEAATSC